MKTRMEIIKTRLERFSRSGRCLAWHSPTRRAWHDLALAAHNELLALQRAERAESVETMLEKETGQ